MRTTLNKIRAHDPCADGWAKLLAHLGKIKADDEPLDLLAILDSNGLDDALWCFRAVEGCDKEMRLYAVWCARQMQHLMKDQRSIDALDVAERFAHGAATRAAWAAARAAAWDAACDAADAAADAAAGAAAWAAADAARVAADAAADAAAGAAAWTAAGAARAAADAAAGAAARAAAMAKQEKHLREILKEVVK